MRKYLFSALAMGLVLTSCQSDEPFAPGAGEEVQASFTISVPDAMGTRAGEVNSAKGGFSNGAGQLNYTVALLNQDNKVMYSETSAGNGTSATFNPTVVQGYTYKILAYATFDNAVEAPTVGQTIADTDAINNIATLKGINDESEDAYFCNDTIKGKAEMAAMLKRPFGKLRLVATDYDKLKALGLDVKSVKVTYGTTVVMEETFDAFNKAFEGDGDNVWSADKATYAEAAANELTVFTDYLPASKTGETMYPFTIVTTYTNGETYTRTFAQDIPVKRNYLTTLRGDFFTTEAALTLEVEEMFANEDPILDTQYTYFTVDTNDELKAALTSNYEHIYVELDANVTYDVAAWENSAMGGDKTKSITINGKQVVTRGGSYDKTLTFNQTNSDWNNIATKNGAKLILKNLNVTNSGRNDGPWNRHDLNFACDVEMDSVYSDKAIALKAGGMLKNVTINDKNTSDTYALWIQPKGQVVTLENCVIDMLGCTDGRGIKIDEQYLPANEVKAPTLYVSRTTFKTEEKAAVIVKSVDGAIINWGERNDISEVAADSEFPVWVDEASAAYADKVIVNGASVRIEGSTVVKTADALKAALDNDNVKTIVLGAGEFGTIVAKSNKTIIGTADARVDCVNLNGADNLTLKNIAFDAATAKYGYDGVGTKKDYAFSNIITGDNVNKPNKGAHNLVIDGCTFTGTFANPGAPIAFTDQKRGEGGSGNITIKNCVFNTVNANYEIYGHYTGDSLNGHGNFVIENNIFKSTCYAGPIYLGRYASSTPVVVKNNVFETVTSIDYAIYVQDHSNYGVSINASGNTFKK